MGRKKDNPLNDLDGTQWLYFTDTIYITRYPPDATHALRKQHGAMKPPEVMAEIIRFFSKEGETVLDPLAGVGGTLLGAALARRQALGVELNPRWVEVYRQIQREFVREGERLVRREAATGGEELAGEMRQGDCLRLLPELPAESVDLVLTDPPYGFDHGATGFADETNFNMLNAGAPADFGNAAGLDDYLELLGRLGREVWRVLRTGRYFVLLVGDRYRQGEYVPLGYLVAQRLRQEGFKLKGVRIWSNQATRRPLKPYAVFTSFVPNITHQNVLILRKETRGAAPRPPERSDRW